jgi:hypothetical protein
MWKHIHGNWSHNHAKHTEQTAWLHTPANADTAIPHHTLVTLSCYQSLLRQTLISIFQHRTKGELV